MLKFKKEGGAVFSFSNFFIFYIFLQYSMGLGLGWRRGRRERAQILQDIYILFKHTTPPKQKSGIPCSWTVGTRTMLKLLPGLSPKPSRTCTPARSCSISS